MQIYDYTHDAPRQQLGDLKLESAAFDEVFAHYNTFWSSPAKVRANLSDEAIYARSNLILRQLEEVERLLKEHGFPTDVRVVLLIGNHTANGHAFLGKQGATAWFAVECFESELETKIFVMHEIIHALHYRDRPEYSFQTMEQKRNVARQLITEGIATYLTRQILGVSSGVALWADRLPVPRLNSWIENCQTCERELFHFVMSHFESSDAAIRIFLAEDPNNIYSYRAGYYAGLKLIELIVTNNHFNERDLLKIPFDEMKQLVWNELQSLNSR